MQLRNPTKETWINGTRKGLSTTWELAKVVFPITFIVGILKYTPLIETLSKFLEPVLVIFGLSGQSALVLVLGNILNPYAAIGTMLTLELAIKEVYILAIMLSLSHNILVETAITTKIGVKPWIAATMRLSLSFIFAFFINLFWKGGQEKAQYLLAPPVRTEVLTEWPDILYAAAQNSFLGVIQIAMIVIPVMIMIQLLKDIDVLPLLAKLMSPLTRLIGVSEKTGVTLLAGLLFGIAYGAGVIIQTAKEENLSKKDIYLVSIFLICCHAIIEDTLVFAPLGINVLYLLLPRFALAVLLTVATAGFWRKFDKRITQ